MTACETIQFMDILICSKKLLHSYATRSLHVWVLLTQVKSRHANAAFSPKTSSPNQLYVCVSIPRHYRCCCIAPIQGSNQVYEGMQSLAFIIDWMARNVARYSSRTIWTTLFNHGALFQVDGWTAYPTHYSQEPKQA